MASIEYHKLTLPKEEPYIKNVLVPFLATTSVLGFTYDLVDNFDRIKNKKTMKRSLIDFFFINLTLIVSCILLYYLSLWEPIGTIIAFLFFIQISAWVISYSYCFLKGLLFTLKLKFKYSVNSPLIFSSKKHFKEIFYSINTHLRGKSKNLSKEEKLEFYFNLFKEEGLTKHEYDKIKSEILQE